MNLLPRNSDDQALSDDVLNETELDSGSIAALPTAGLGRRTRLGISLATVVLLVVVLVTAHSWWLPPAQNAWMRIFPPPPYTGTLTYAHTGARLFGVRAADGGIQWTANVSNSDTNSIVHGDTIITASTNASMIVALRAADGHTIWQTATPAGYTRPLLWQDAQQIYLWYSPDAGPTKPLYEALDPRDGHVRWSITINGYPFYSQQSSNDTLPFCVKEVNPADGTSNNLIIAVDRKNGKERWRSSPLVTPSEQSTSCRVTGATVISDWEQPGGSQMTAYDLQSGAQRWQIAYRGRLANIDQNAVYTTTWYIDQQPSAADTDTLTAWRATDGQRLWQTSGSLNTFVYSPVAHASLLTITPTGLAGIDPLSGAILWQRTHSTNDIMKLSIQYGAGDVIYFADREAIYALHSITGTIMWQKTLPASLQQGLIVQLYADHGSVYGLSQLALTAFDGANGHILWNNTQSFSDLICGSCG